MSNFLHELPTFVFIFLAGVALGALIGATYMKKVTDWAHEIVHKPHESPTVKSHRSS